MSISPLPTRGRATLDRGGDRGRTRPRHRFDRTHRRLPILREALDEIASGVFSTEDAARYRGLVDTLTHHDYFMICPTSKDDADEDRPSLARPEPLLRSSVLNTANVGWFSSDRTIAEYAKEIWSAPFVPIS
jgi:starch phosphorylase